MNIFPRNAQTIRDRTLSWFLRMFESDRPSAQEYVTSAPCAALYHAHGQPHPVSSPVNSLSLGAVSRVVRLTMSKLRHEVTLAVSCHASSPLGVFASTRASCSCRITDNTVLISTHPLAQEVSVSFQQRILQLVASSAQHSQVAGYQTV
jgi:glycerate-2-kinase